jgi:hypothetical protein
VFSRPKKFTASAIRFNGHHSGGSLGTLRIGTLRYRYFQPEQHQFWSQGISQDSIMLNVAPGKVYFVNGGTKMGVVVGRPKFRQVDESTGRAKL